MVEAALQKSEDRGWIDLQRGIFYPRSGRKETKKEQPTIRLPAACLHICGAGKRMASATLSSGMVSRSRAWRKHFATRCAMLVSHET